MQREGVRQGARGRKEYIREASADRGVNPDHGRVLVPGEDLLRVVTKVKKEGDRDHV